MESVLPAQAVGVDFDAVYSAHVDFVWRSLRRLGVAVASLDDATQDVFLVVHRRLRGFEQRSSVKTWLFAIALRVARDFRKRAQRGGPEPIPPTLVDARPGPHEAAAHAERIRVLDEVLGEMNEQKRETFVCAELEQMTAPEIAEALGENVNTVYSRIRAARIEFEELLRKRQGAAHD